MIWSIAAVVLISLGLSVTTEAADSVRAVVVVPKTLYAANPATVSVTTLSVADNSPVTAAVEIWFKEGTSGSTKVFARSTGYGGRLGAEFDVPDVEAGAYTLEFVIGGVSEHMTSQVQVSKMPVLLIETDKPIYKPGQTIQGRVLTLTNELRPDETEVSVEIKDAKGIKIFRKELTTNAFGVAPFELDLATELNFGTWKITAESGSATTTIDVRVEKYVLPRFDVEVVTEHDYFLVDDAVTGIVNANYFFGKSVDGTVEITASRYVGVWEEYATYTGTLSNGSLDFELPAVGYVSGTSGAGGAGSAQLDVVVTDTSGHEEKTNKLLKIVETTIQHQLIGLSKTITPGQAFEVVVVAKTPEGEPLTASADLTCDYYDQHWTKIDSEERSVSGFNGAETVEFAAPAKTAWATIKSTANSGGESASAEISIYAAYSPTDSFLHLSRSSDEPINVGDIFSIDVFKTHDATIYYDVFAKGQTLWSSYTRTSQITLLAMSQMVPSAKVVAYIINPNNEISADSLPFEVQFQETAALDVQFNAEEVLPGEAVQVSVKAGTEAMVGVAIVDESVYALNEGRLNMQEVFDELERRFMEPQQETHESPSPYGAYEIFDEAGLRVLVSGDIDVPKGEDIWPDWAKDDWWWRGGWEEGPWVVFNGDADGDADGAVPPSSGGEEETPLAEVTRVRQFFPETWLWMPELLTDVDGAATIDLTAPDSITTWRLHAVSTSDDGLGMSESGLLVFQEFFGEPDLPYAVTRGEQFPVRVQVFNYLNEPQLVHVELADANWFELLEESNTQQVLVDANSVGLASFLIQPTELGRNMMEVTLRSTQRADAVQKDLLVEPEGTRRELINNGTLAAGESVVLDTTMPAYRVPGSEKVLLSITPSLVAQTIGGIEDLLGMPYGCGEQNMIFFAPDVEILRYLDATDQLTPEIRAEAEHFIICGYQRELTYRHSDGSFSAFGESDESGSLWLTAFVLSSFSSARDVQTIDETILTEAAAWIESHQLADGSLEPIGFIHHKEMLGGMQGNYALTAFVMIALTDYGFASQEVLDKAAQYLEANLTGVYDDAYALAIASLAFVRTDNAAADAAIAKLMELAITDGNGIHWEPYPVETTAYAALALMEAEEPAANDAIKWLSLQRNSMGGYGGSTQDTVMALKALIKAAYIQTRNVDLVVTVMAVDSNGYDGPVLVQFTVNESNFDVLQIAEIAAEGGIKLTASNGSGETRFQLVRKFNVLLCDDIIQRDMAIEVDYDASHVEVDDIVGVNVTVRYFGFMASTGMMIVDVGVPTGFSAVAESLEALLGGGSISRYEVAGRKVILYVDELVSGEMRRFSFQVKARFPVRALIPDSKVYLYYDPGIRAEAAGTKITVGFDVACLGDLNSDGQVDLRDLSEMVDALVKAGPPWIASVDAGHSGDFDEDDQISLADLDAMINLLLNVGPPFIVPCE